MKTEAEKDCVVVRCGGCKRLVIATVNDPRTLDTKMFTEIADAVRDGCTVEHVTTEEVRKAKFGCKCK